MRTAERARTCDEPADHLLGSNVIKAMVRDGIDLMGGTNHHLVKNEVTRCGAEGIDNSAAVIGTLCDKNELRDNRIDMANAGTGNETGNQYDTDGWSTPPQVD